MMVKNVKEIHQINYDDKGHHFYVNDKQDKILLISQYQKIVEKFLANGEKHEPKSLFKEMLSSLYSNPQAKCIFPIFVLTCIDLSVNKFYDELKKN